jgi:hypothetical protein
MENYTNRNEESLVATLGTPSRTSWGAIWTGVFTFIAIWSVFGMLGEAIFATSVNPNAATPIGGGISVGMVIWFIVLMIVAMYVAGMATGYLTNTLDRMVKIMHGMAMFGLSVFAIALMVILGGNAISGVGTTGGTANPHSPYMWSMFSDVGWASFIALFLGWLAAIGGAAQRTTRALAEEHVVGERRRAA